MDQIPTGTTSLIPFHVRINIETPPIAILMLGIQLCDVSSTNTKHTLHTGQIYAIHNWYVRFVHCVHFVISTLSTSYV